MKKTFPHFVFVALFLCIASIALATKKNNSLTLVLGNSPRHLNHAVQSGVVTAFPGTQIFASPLKFDENWNPRPYLAKSWSVSKNGKKVTLNLVDNARFHDGKPITSADVAFSIKTVKENHPFKTMFSPVSSIDTPDKLTVVINLSKPHPAILLAMSPTLLPVIPKHIYGDGQDPKSHPRNRNPVGSGPYKFVEYTQGERIVLVKNEDYFIKGLPYLDKLIFRINRDPSSVFLAFSKGDYDFMSYSSMPLRQVKKLGKKNHLKITHKGYGAIGPLNWLAFNLKDDILKRVKVRQAIAYAIDKKFIVKRLHAGLSKHANSPLTKDSPFHYDNLNPYDLDLKKAKSLLDDAGYPMKNGKRFSLKLDYIPGFDEMQKLIAEYLKPQLNKVGIDIQLRSSPDFPTWAKRVGGHEFQLSMDVVFNWGDPIIGVHRTYISSNIKKGVIWSNTQNYRNAEVDTILEKAGSETNPDKRKALYVRFQKIVNNELPQYFINSVPYYTIYKKGLTNIPLGIWGSLSPLDELKWK